MEQTNSKLACVLTTYDQTSAIRLPGKDVSRSWKAKEETKLDENGVVTRRKRETVDESDIIRQI